VSLRPCKAEPLERSGKSWWGEATDPSSVAVFRVLPYCSGLLRRVDEPGSRGRSPHQNVKTYHYPLEPRAETPEFSLIGSERWPTPAEIGD